MTYIPSLYIAMFVSFFLPHLIVLSASEFFQQSIIKFPLYAALGFLCAGIIASGIIYCVEKKLQSIDHVQKKLGTEQNSENVAFNEEGKIEKEEPSTVLKIHSPPKIDYSTNYSYGGGSRISNDAVAGYCLGIAFASFVR